jgi:hypothetical protein
MNSDASTLRPMTLRQSTIMQLARGSFLGRLKVVSFVALILGGTSAFGASYEELRSAAVGKCQATDPSAYQSGLFFNPDGYRSYYVRSECFQSTAVRFRDETLCAQVRQRYSLLSSSWGYSAARCRQLVEEGAAADRNALEEMKRLYTSGAVRLRDFRLERNGNGRDFDIIPSFVGEYAHGYILRFEIIQTETGKQPALLHSSGFYLDGNSNIRIFVRQSDLRKGFPELSLNHPYTVRATLVLDIGNGGQSGQWSDAFIERVFPTRARTQLLDREVRF